jgi:hypothetical protein
MFSSGLLYIQRGCELGLLGVLRRIWQRIKLMLTYLPQRCLYGWRVVRPRKHVWTSIDEQIAEIFLSNSIQEEERYYGLLSYLVSGFIYYRASDLAHVYYPGASSTHGAAIDAMEGFSRALPMISAWIYSGRPSVIHNFFGQEIDLLKVAREGLIAGTNPKSKGFWGDISDSDQRIVEAADIALSIWLLRDHLWPQLALLEKEMISRWLLSVNGKAIPDNNWHLFPVMVNEVLFSLDYVGDQMLSQVHYARLKSFYLGNGWFSDGPEGEIDYYNAWCIHYSLFWINLINPKLDPDFIDSSLNDFVRNYKYFFSPDGIPIAGRSICYRMAAPSPLIAAATKQMNGVSSGIARRALDCVWKYFIKMGAIHHGKITQGYWQEDLSLLDNYSGPGSSLWSTRSLALAFYSPPCSRFWTEPLENLPVEQNDYTVLIPEINWEIRGSKLTKEIQIIKINNADNFFKKDEEKNSVFTRFLVFVLGLPYRSQDKHNRNKLHQYSSLYPFWMPGVQNKPAGVDNETI